MAESSNSIEMRYILLVLQLMSLSCH